MKAEEHAGIEKQADQKKIAKNIHWMQWIKKGGLITLVTERKKNDVKGGRKQRE